MNPVEDYLKHSLDIHLIGNYPNSLLLQLNAEQKKSFEVLLNKKNLVGLNLTKELNKTLSRFRGLISTQKNYKELLIEICNRRNLNITKKMTVKELEELILTNKYKVFINNLSPEERKKFQSELEAFAQKNGIDPSQLKSLSAIGTLAGANFAGFGLYVMASTVVGGITSAIGLTLPFAVYTGMSSALSVITGPVGWIAGLGYLAYTFRNDNMESAQNKIKGSLNAIKGLAIGNLEHAELIVSQICSYRILLVKEETIKLSEKKNRLEQIAIEKSNQYNQKQSLQEQIEKLTAELMNTRKIFLRLDNESQQLSKEIKEIENNLSLLK